ncbi:hypothetical protein EVAR_66192_1 [Eumeta japonica]|uniref:Gustatory receptor n=1 Tax=Eumeta variegata TaxID=151549 RepID=A0A4C1ZT18_EUMVA|nr:hypothetical protein EVAR_66192_1 [Eumeta japonica]
MTKDTFLGNVNLLQVWLFFYALIAVAASGECVLAAAGDLCRSLARLSSELCRDNESLELCAAARDVLRAVRVSQLRLSACALFDLRMTLVTAFLSLTATYSIVLLQLTHFL